MTTFNAKAIEKTVYAMCFDEEITANAVALFITKQSQYEIPLGQVLSKKYGYVDVLWGGDLLLRNMGTGSEYKNSDIKTMMKEKSISTEHLLSHLNGFEHPELLNYEVVDIPFFMFRAEDLSLIYTPASEIPFKRLSINPAWVAQLS
jgi:hypothetical protein